MTILRSRRRVQVAPCLTDEHGCRFPSGARFPRRSPSTADIEELLRRRDFLRRGELTFRTYSGRQTGKTGWAMNSRKLELSLFEARQGSESARRELLHIYRNYLKLLARLRIGRTLQSKLDESDLVQETLLNAWRTFEDFRGQTEAELMQWLRSILASTTASHLRHFRTAKRDLALERQLQHQFDQSSRLLDRALLDRENSPSQNAVRRERARQLADAIQQLPPDYREVIILRHLEGLPLVQIADRLGQSANSIQKTWARALIKLHELLKDLA